MNRSLSQGPGRAANFSLRGLADGDNGIGSREILSAPAVQCRQDRRWSASERAGGITVSFEHLFRAQFGEDRILWRVFRGRTCGYFVEVGAYDGITLSNTYFLERMGWCGLLIEPIAALCERAVKSRPRSRVLHSACGKRGSNGTTTFTIAQNVPVLSYLHADREHVDRCLREGAKLIEVEVPLTTLDDALTHERRNPPPFGGPWVRNKGWCIDLVSIDTEGCELEVLDGFDLKRFRPRVLMIENDRPAGEAIEPYLAQRGYRKFHRQQINDFYVRTDDPCHDLTVTGLTDDACE